MSSAQCTRSSPALSNPGCQSAAWVHYLLSVGAEELKTQRARYPAEIVTVGDAEGPEIHSLQSHLICRVLEPSYNENGLPLTVTFSNRRFFTSPPTLSCFSSSWSCTSMSLSVMSLISVCPGLPAISPKEPNEPLMPVSVTLRTIDF